MCHGTGGGLAELDDDGADGSCETCLSKWFGNTAATDFDSIDGARLKHSDALANEFEASDDLLVGAFPSVFLLGKACGGSSGDLSVEQQNHPLKQFMQVPAQN